MHGPSEDDANHAITHLQVCTSFFAAIVTICLLGL
jgi:hypothetical protein